MNRCIGQARVAALSVCLGVTAGVARAQEFQPPFFWDWGIRNEYHPDFPEFVPMPHPGADWSPEWVGYQLLFMELLINGDPITIMLRDDTAPGHDDPDTLDRLAAVVPKIDFLLADYEGIQKDQHVIDMAEWVRTHPNPNIRNARMGNYADYPGLVDHTRQWPWLPPERPERHALYMDNLDIAMPAAYPFAVYQVHADPAIWGDNTAPSERAALFWAPLERTSVAARALPPGHLLVPWVVDFGPLEGYDPEPPPKADRQALIQHLRLRGVDGVIVLTSFIPDLGPDAYRAEVMEAWRSVDPIFAQDGELSEQPVFLNLETDKGNAVYWSGVRRGTEYMIVVSNLSDEPARVALPSQPGLPRYSPWVQPGSHLLMSHLADDAVREPAAAGDREMAGG